MSKANCQIKNTKRIVFTFFVFVFLVFLPKNPAILEEFFLRIKIDEAKAAEESYQVPVLVLKYFPLKDGRLDLALTGRNWLLEEARQRTEQITLDAVDSLEKGSIYHGYNFPDSSLSLDYEILETMEFLEPIPVSNNQVPWNEGWFRPDYMKILSDLNICDWVDNKGVREIWMWGYHYNGLEPVESNMAMGKASQNYWNFEDYGDAGNSERTNDMPICQHTYSLFNYSIMGGLGNVLEDHTHHLEGIYKYIDYDLFWNRFVGTCGEQEFYRCGWTHKPPNTMKVCGSSDDYNWGSEQQVLSDCQDWTPNAVGEKSLVDCHTWAGADCNQHFNGPNAGGIAFKVWWMQNLPGKDNDIYYQEKKMINWWDYVGDFDEAVKFTNKSFFYPESYNLSPTPVFCNKIGDANNDGEINKIDFEIWESEFLIGEANSADFNCDNKISLIDFEIWRARFNAKPTPTVNTPTPSLTLAPTSTPTPTPALITTPTPTPTINPSCLGGCPLITEKKSGTMVTWNGETLCYVKLSWKDIEGAVGFKVCRNSACVDTPKATSYVWEWVACDNNSLYNVSPIFEGCSVGSCPKVAVKTPIAQ